MALLMSRYEGGKRAPSDERDEDRRRTAAVGKDAKVDTDRDDVFAEPRGRRRLEGDGRFGHFRPFE
jgi:hypothetical protein